MLFPTRSPRRRPLGVVGAVVFGIVLALGVPDAGAAPAQSEERAEVLVSISAPNEVDSGDDAVFGVTVRELGSGAAITGMRVVLQRRALGESGWAEADRAVTGDAGQAVLSARVRPPATEFRARMPRTEDYRAGRTAPVTVTTN